MSTNLTGGNENNPEREVDVKSTQLSSDVDRLNQTLQEEDNEDERADENNAAASNLNENAAARKTITNAPAHVTSNRVTAAKLTTPATNRTDAQQQLDADLAILHQIVLDQKDELNKPKFKWANDALCDAKDGSEICRIQKKQIHPAPTRVRLEVNDCVNTFTFPNPKHPKLPEVLAQFNNYPKMLNIECADAGSMKDFLNNCGALVHKLNNIDFSKEPNSLIKPEHRQELINLLAQKKENTPNPSATQMTNR
ncbi:MAG TPA: hypothetical protein VLG38_07355 [Gammaproteobacteria bacterium]|nr:hypothetical protein [Gammaproteobacteria bacterium]